jgi:hypothetical protein
MYHINSSGIARRFYFLLLSCVAVSQWACKDPDALGLEVLPATDQLQNQVVDTFTIAAKTIKADTLRTDESIVRLLTVGSLVDPIFGTTNASCYANLNFGFTPTFGDTAGLVADSIVLTLQYGSYYGKTGLPLQFKVEALAADMDAAAAYNNNKSFPVKSIPLATQWIRPAPKDSITIDNVKYLPHIRIKLDKALADSIIQDYKNGQLSSNSNWISRFKGIKISTNTIQVPQGGTIFHFDPFAAFTKATLYYHNDTVPFKYDFVLYGAARSNAFYNHYSNAHPELIQAITGINNSKSYIQSLAGLKIQLQIPFLKLFANPQSIVINRAELILTQDQPRADLFPPPVNLMMLREAQNGTQFFLRDYLLSPSLFGGIFNTNSNTYSFNITQHVQDVIDGQTDNDPLNILVLYTIDNPASAQSANRVVIKSGNGDIKLKLTYTKIQ